MISIVELNENSVFVNSLPVTVLMMIELAYEVGKKLNSGWFRIRSVVPVKD